MTETTGNIWDWHEQGYWAVITTNGAVKQNGACVMGRGVALEAAQRYPRLPFALGNRIRIRGNHVHAFPDHRIISFPVKHHWKEPADLALIERSVGELLTVVGEIGQVQQRIVMVRPGCGAGQLSWETVKPLLTRLDDRFVVVGRTILQS